MCQRLFFRRISKNRDYIQTHCNNRRNTFHFACRQWYSYNNPGILTRIHIQILVFLFLFSYEYYFVII